MYAWPDYPRIIRCTLTFREVYSLLEASLYSPCLLFYFCRAVISRSGCYVYGWLYGRCDFSHGTSALPLVVLTLGVVGGCPFRCCISFARWKFLVSKYLFVLVAWRCTCCSPQICRSWPLWRASNKLWMSHLMIGRSSGSSQIGAVLGFVLEAARSELLDASCNCLKWRLWL